ncbi:UNKNOWN [Stylonychia lemnae]|uniref:TLDc domain-containing protein n=1 Tax=Stylonychia lemnae TaxID=5949 RepID=A0A077ZW47_STYLE|nr:UNKNOWN [Stylonychia lemnae]|eukprot:CDW72676.1 UNKNOWN [Stylonychia lemnae]
MNKTLLLNGHQPMIQSDKQSTKKQLLHNAAVFSLGFAMHYVWSSQNQTTCLDGVEDNQSLWLEEPRNNFEWKNTTDLYWGQTSSFIDISSSPSGELYGIQQYEDDKYIFRYGFKFNFVKGDWQLFDDVFQPKDIKFDKLGNFYALDKNNQLYAQNSKTKVILKNIKDFEVTGQGKIYAISETITKSNPQQLLNTWIQGDGYQYKLFSPTQFSKLALKDEVPIYVDAQGNTIGYGQQCVKDITVGVDGSIWALSCVKDKLSDNFQLIRWDPNALQWYSIKSIYGIKIAAYNEVSISVLDCFGRIMFSSDKSKNNQFDYIKQQLSPQLLADSKILNQTNLPFVQSLIDKEYSISTLCYRGTENGFTSQNFHQKCDYKGPTLTIIKTATGRVAGGYTSQPWKSASRWVTDKEAFIFSAEIQVKFPAKGPNAINDNYDNGPTFGDGYDLYVATNSNASSKSFTDLGKAYDLPSGMEYQSSEARSYLFGNMNFKTSEVEVYYLQ